MNPIATEALLPRHLTPIPLRNPTLSLISNFYRPITSPTLHIHVYAMNFTPEVPYEARSLRIELLSSVEDQVTTHISGHLLSGINLFSIRKNEAVPLLSPQTASGDKYELRITHVREVPMNSTESRQDTQLVLNVVLKRALRALGLVQVTRLPKFYDRSTTETLRAEKLKIYRGYTTELTFRLGRPLITIDFSSKIVRLPNLMKDLLEFKDRINSQTWKAEAKSLFEGRIVMTNYGNNHCYRMDEICFNMNPSSTFDLNGSPISYLAYYQSRYQITISDNRQPLIRSHIKKRLQEFDIYFVPELVSLTGLDDAQRSNRQLMQKIAETTSLPPAKRLNTSRDLAIKLNTPIARTALSQFGFSVPTDSLPISGYDLSRGEILRNVEVNKGNFVGRFGVAEPVSIQSYAVVDFNVDAHMKDTFLSSLADRFREIGTIFAGQSNHRCDVRTFPRVIAQVADAHPGIVIVLLQKNQRHLYEMIKKNTITMSVVPTQVVMLPINDRRYEQIIEKIALQIQAKAGAKLWLPHSTDSFGRDLMVVGVDVFHDTVNRKKSVLGFCATIDRDLSKYYSTIAMHETGQEIATALGTLLVEALAVYMRMRNRYPETVIFFRDGVSESQVEAVRELEVRSVLQACERVMNGESAYKPNLIYTVVIKKTAAKFYKKGTVVSSPDPGTLITDEVVPESGDFYLISHYASQGISAPILYRTIYASRPDGFPLEELARLAYKLCHMYYNWSGAIKVPAPCMMAHKIAFLVGQCVHEEVSPQLRECPFYL